MCSKFVIEMPSNKLGRSTSIIVGTILTVMIAPVLSIFVVFSASNAPWLTGAVVVSLSLTALVIGAVVIRKEVSHYRYQMAEEMLAQAVSRLGWRALEPIAITGRKSRVLLRDAVSGALWNVWLEHDKITCQRHVPSVVNDVVK